MCGFKPMRKKQAYQKMVTNTNHFIFWCLIKAKNI